MDHADDKVNVLSAPGGTASGPPACAACAIATGAYQYKHGDRPLEGYTIQRALGRGGFGEVYFAVSDAGRQVALKAINTYEQIELRGVGQCMNLKSPHLVTIFDVKHNAAGRPFVIMEYVSGPSLAEILAESSGGLGPQKAAFFLREIAKALTFLHEAGIVHRDLKPANVFYEDGYVKIGDYGLSKAIAASHCGGQTITVGTVHYMAPEIGEGNYDRGIDIYAMGVVLYEMLTGSPPFVGDSIGEILMKHLAGKVDLSGVAEPFATAIGRAMEKDPSQRFRTVQEMVECVYGSQQVRSSVSLFSPNTLTMVAGRVAGEMAMPAMPAPPALPSAAPPAPPVPQPAPVPAQHAAPAAPPALPPGAVVEADGKVCLLDPVRRGQRVVLALMAMAMMAVGTALVGGKTPWQGEVWLRLAEAAAIMMGAFSGAALARRWVNLPSDSPMLWRLAYGTLACILAAVPLCVLVFAFEREIRIAAGRPEAVLSTLAPVCIVLFVLDWRKLADARRKDRISVRMALWYGLLAGVLAEVLDGTGVLAGGALAGIVLSVQVAAEHRRAAEGMPWDRKGKRGASR
jgi:hypothetical protein